MGVKIKEDIKCLTAVLAAATLSRDGLKEAGDMMKRVDQQLEVEYKGLAWRLGTTWTQQKPRLRRKLPVSL